MFPVSLMIASRSRAFVQFLDADFEIYTKLNEEENVWVVVVDSGLDWLALNLESTPMTVSHQCCFLRNTPLMINQELLIYGFVWSPDCSRFQDALHKWLDLHGVGVGAGCERLFQEPLNVQVAWDGELSAATMVLDSTICETALDSD